MLKCITPDIKKTYVGYTNNIELRLEKHNNSKGAKSTKGYKWVVIYIKKFKNKNDAMSFEYQLKNDKNKRKMLLDSYNL
tara:strand:+ start:65 stop:301 length:237 start_codon:yes stop_codon:yes gene_type:complete